MIQAAPSLKSPLHKFRNLKPVDTTYITRLVVASDNMCLDTVKIPITVHAEVRAGFVIDQASGCARLPVHITDISYSPASIAGYDWNFGDGTVIDTNNFNLTQHIYQNLADTAEKFTIRLIVSNSANCTDTFEHSVVVNPQIIAKFTASDSLGCQPLNVNFDASGSLNANAFLWNLGDGVSSGDSAFSHTYANLSYNDTLYNVNLVVYNSADGCSDTTHMNIKVGSWVKADFQIQPSSGCSPLDVNINNTSQNWNGLTLQHWSFGDGLQDTVPGHLFSHVYLDTTQAILNLTLELETKNDLNCRDTMVRSITVYPQVIAGFKADTLSGCQPLAVSFTNTSNQPVARYFNWNFGDGTTSAGINVVDTFRNLSSHDTVFHVHLQALSQQQCEADTTLPVSVYAFIHAGFTVPEANQCSGSQFDFINSSLGGVSLYTWQFYGNGIINLQVPAADTVENTYMNLTANNEVYSVKLIVKNNHACFDSILSPVTIYPQVIADFSMDSAGCTPDTISFTNKSIHSSYWNWYFGNQGNTSADSNPVHTFINKSDRDTVISVKLYSLISKSLYRFNCKKCLYILQAKINY